MLDFAKVMPSTHFQLFKPDDLQTSDEVFVSVQISGLGTKQIGATFLIVVTEWLLLISKACRPGS